MTFFDDPDLRACGIQPKLNLYYDFGGIAQATRLSQKLAFFNILLILKVIPSRTAERDGHPDDAGA